MVGIRLSRGTARASAASATAKAGSTAGCEARPVPLGANTSGGSASAGTASEASVLGRIHGNFLCGAVDLSEFGLPTGLFAQSKH